MKQLRGILRPYTCQFNYVSMAHCKLVSKINYIYHKICTNSIYIYMASCKSSSLQVKQMTFNRKIDHIKTFYRYFFKFSLSVNTNRNVVKS